MRPHAVNRNLLLWIGLFFFLTAFTPATAQESSKDIIKHVKQAVVVITTYDMSGKPLFQGTGFFIESRRLITSLHVIKNAYRAQIKTFDGKTYLVKGIVDINEPRDLVLLETGGTSPGCTTLIVEEAIPAEGEEIIVVSNPKGSSWKVSKGFLETRWDFLGSGELIQITASILPGSSGGPVVNRRGRVVGVASMHVDSSEDLNFAVPGELIKTLTTGTLRPLPGYVAQVLER